MHHYLLTWRHPALPNATHEKWAADVVRGGSITIDFTCANSSVVAGDRVFILRQGDQRGMTAAGHATGPSFVDDHGKRRVPVKLTEVVPVGKRLDRSALDVGELEAGPWNTRQSGVRIPSDVAAALENAWRAHIAGDANRLTVVKAPKESAIDPRSDARAFLFLWNPSKDTASFKRFEKVVADSMAGIVYKTSWICPSSQPQPGDIAFMKRVGERNNGIFARGVVTAAAAIDSDGEQRVRLELVSFLPLGKEIAAHEAAKDAVAAKLLAPQGSGTELPIAIVDKIDEIWTRRQTARSGPPDAAGTVDAQTKTRPEGVAVPTAIMVPTRTFARDARVAEWVLQRAAGKCECCHTPAPFVDENGVPFLEVHHPRRLADGGPDTVQNAAAVCPNCHRRLHHGRDRVALTKKVVDRITALERVRG